MHTPAGQMFGVDLQQLPGLDGHVVCQRVRRTPFKILPAAPEHGLDQINQILLDDSGNLTSLVAQQGGDLDVDAGHPARLVTDGMMVTQQHGVIGQLRLHVEQRAGQRVGDVVRLPPTVGERPFVQCHPADQPAELLDHHTGRAELWLPAFRRGHPRPQRPQQQPDQPECRKPRLDRPGQVQPARPLQIPPPTGRGQGDQHQRDEVQRTRFVRADLAGVHQQPGTQNDDDNDRQRRNDADDGSGDTVERRPQRRQKAEQGHRDEHPWRGEVQPQRARVVKVVEDAVRTDPIQVVDVFPAPPRVQPARDPGQPLGRLDDRMTRVQGVVGENPQAVDHGPGHDVGGSPGHHAQLFQMVTPRLVEPTAAVDLDELDPQVLPQLGEPGRSLSHRGPDNHPRLMAAEQHPPATHARHCGVSVRDPACTLPQQ